MPRQPTTVEAKLLARLNRVEARLRDLQAEKGALERLLLDFRKEDPMKREVGRRSSVKKAITEERILEMLRRAPTPMTSGQIYSRLEADGHEINYSTLRSYVRRLFERGLLTSVPGNKWRHALSDG